MTDEISIDTVMLRRFDLDEQIAIIQGRQAAEIAPLVEEKKLCEQYIKDAMNTGNLQQLKIACGHQAYFTTKDSVKVGDWDAALAYIRTHNAFELLNQAVNKTACKEFIEEHKEPPPGVAYESFRDLAWRRGKATN
jgi:hypothetical protein